MTYEEALELAEQLNCDVKEIPMQTYDGRIKGNHIYLRKDMTTAKKADTLLEEIAHCLTTVGDILDQDTVTARKQERLARALAYRTQVPLSALIDAAFAGCENAYQTAEHIGVSEDTLKEAVEFYREVYGVCTNYKGYIIRFMPTIEVYRYVEIE